MVAMPIGMCGNAEKYNASGATQDYVFLNSDEVQSIQGELKVSIDEKVLSTVK